MFVRVIRAQVSTKPMLRNAWDHLGEALSSRPGWRCIAGGITRAGRFVGTVEFTDSDAAHAGWSNPDVQRWMQELERSVEAIESVDSSDAATLLAGARGEAGFLQIIEARTTDKARWLAINEAMQEVMRTHRPEVLAATIAWQDDHFIETVYFTSEHEAREGESREFPGGMEGLFSELMDLVEDLTYEDLRSPWLRVRPEVDPAPKPEG